jgi:hypothetical protein
VNAAPESVPPPAAVRAMQDAMTRAALRDSVGAMDALEVLLDYGMHAVYAASCSWAEVIKRFTMLCDDGGVVGFAVLEVLDEQGRRLDPADVAPEQRAKVWAAQFLTAHCNDDDDMRRALFDAHVERDPGRAAENVLALLSAAGAAIRSHTPNQGTDPI